ncbi:MAG: VOC family protein [Deltaproteobacteria bacterium]|nr:VOC family protein [Deltaproteobacteria bacterium]
MPKLETLGIKRLDSLHYYVHDIERVRSLFVDKMDFTEIGASGEAMNRRGKQRSVVFNAGEATFVFAEPMGVGGAAWRFLKKHPEGIGTLVFEVEDIHHAYKLLDERGATLMGEPESFENLGTNWTFSITTPFGDTTFRFVQRENPDGGFPDYVPHDEPRGGTNKFGFHEVDHITSNFLTMKPALLWMQHVMGFEEYWEVAFHTDDINQKNRVKHGSGLKSVVMWDPNSGIKFANNEPAPPNFRASQIHLFAEDHRGAGIQHTALTVPDIIGTVRQLRDAGVAFMPTPDTYYDMLPARLKTIGVNEIEEDIEVLRELEILVDGGANLEYMLQIFLQEQATQFKAAEAGPFFIEVIQRKGDRGFGAGNFRALFESIERQQVAAGRIS